MCNECVIILSVECDYFMEIVMRILFFVIVLLGASFSPSTFAEADMATQLAALKQQIKQLEELGAEVPPDLYNVVKLLEQDTKGESKVQIKDNYFDVSGHPNLARCTQHEDQQLFAYCQNAYLYYQKYVELISAGASQSDIDGTYAAHKKSAEIAIQYDKTTGVGR